MKRIYLIASMLVGALAFSACEKEEKTPVLQEPADFVLNTPAYANNTYNLEASKTLELTCCQPDYGFTAAVTYQVEASLTGEWGEGKSVLLSGEYTNAKINVDAAELAAELTTLSGKDEKEFPMVLPVHLRLHAALSNSGLGEVTSNEVILPNVRLHFALPPVSLPEKLYMIGDCNGWDWGAAYDMVPVHSHPGVFWRLAYTADNTGFKVNTNKAWDGGEKGFAAVTVQDNAEAGVKDAGGNIGITKGGWYLFVVRTSLSGRDILYNVEVAPAKVYTIGIASTTGTWDIDDKNLFEVPATADGFFKSQPYANDIAGNDADGCLRACVKLSDADWWQTEFMVFSNELVYRGTGNDQERVGAKKGQSLYINFTDGTGKVE